MGCFGPGSLPKHVCQFKAVVNHLEEFLVSRPGLDLQTTILVAGTLWSSPSKILINLGLCPLANDPEACPEALPPFWKMIADLLWPSYYDPNVRQQKWTRRHAVVCCQNRLSAGDDYGASNSRLNGCVDPLVLRLRMCLWLATSVSTGSRLPSTSWWKEEGRATKGRHPKKKSIFF